MITAANMAGSDAAIRLAKKCPTLRRLSKSLTKLMRTKSGVAMVEFGLVAPIMVLTLLGLIEIVDLAMANRKVSNVTTSVADLVARVPSIDNQGVDDVFAAADSLLDPFEGTDLKLTITSIVADATGQAFVHWSERNVGDTPYIAGQAYTEKLPEGVLNANESLILTELEFAYGGAITSFFVDAYTMEDSYLARPRRSRTVLRCDDLNLEKPTCL